MPARGGAKHRKARTVNRTEDPMAAPGEACVGMDVMRRFGMDVMRRFGMDVMCRLNRALCAMCDMIRRAHSAGVGSSCASAHLRRVLVLHQPWVHISVRVPEGRRRCVRQ